MTDCETFAFQAEINQLLSLIINTFYSNKEIFLRELISNSSDALDKIRFQSLKDLSVLKEQEELFIHIICDKDNKKISIIDTGVGMTKKDLIDNLGTIAQSGTKNFMEALSSGADISMIGQFGVGFYSSYLVADRVIVTSKNNEDEQFIWDSCAGGTFTVTKDTPENNLKRGTKIDLYLKEDHLEYLETNKIKELIKKHSAFINYPISIQVDKTIEEEVDDDIEEPKPDTDETSKNTDEHKPDTEETSKDTDEPKSDTEEPKPDTEETSKDTEETSKNTEETSKDTEEPKPDTDETSKDTDEPIIEDVDEETNVKKMKKVTRIEKEWELCNVQKPIWVRNQKDITKEEYTSFYKSISNDWEEELALKHFSVEGQMEFKSLLFIPKRAPHDSFTKNKKLNNIKLYVRRVFISEDNNDLCPEWLSFVKGIVDSEDLPLNISREVLQQNKILKVMKKNIVKKILELFNEIAKDNDKYLEFYEQYSKNIKLGMHEDDNNREKIAKLLRFTTSKSNNELISFEKYVENMQDEQKDIYFIIGESKEYVEKAPFLEKLIKKNMEVIYMTDPIDEYMMQQVKEYDGKKFVNISKSNFKLDNDDNVEKHEEFCKSIKNILDKKIENVIVSNRLITSPCCLVTSEYGWSANMERIMKAQALNNNSMNSHMSSKKTLELNTQHIIVKELINRYNSDKNDNSFKNLVYLMYDTSLLSSGFSIENPQLFSDRMYNMIKMGLSVDENDDSSEKDIDLDKQPTVCNESTDSLETKMEEVD
jgi:molecular chaperone HtpG